MPEWMVPVSIGFAAAITYTLTRIDERLAEIVRLLRERK